MKIKSEKQFLMLIINVLLDPILNSSGQSIRLQIFKKEILNQRINRICKVYLRHMKADEPTKIRFIYITGFLIRFLYKARFNYFQHFKFLKNTFLFIYLSYISLKFRTLWRFFTSFGKLGFEYKFNSHRHHYYKDIVIVSGFPSHSLEFINKKIFNSSTYSSFAEYLVDTYGEDFCLLSLDEYIRKSKSKQIKNDNLNLTNKMKMVSLSPSFSMKFFLRNFYNLIRKFSILDLNSVYRMLDAIYYNNSIGYIRLINQTNCRSFYVMPFSDFNYYTDEILGKFTTFQYSENFLIPPFNKYSKLNKSKSISTVLNPSALSSRCSMVGFVSFYTKISNDLLRFLLSSKGDILEKKNDKPVALGFEKRLNLNDNGLFISIFDNPPEIFDKQLARSIYGDIASNADFVEGFLFEILTVAKATGFKVLLKPKYDLSNYTDSNYSAFIDSMLKRFPSILTLVDPYVRLGDVIKKSSVIVSHPYTSTKTFADHMNKKSYYYVPEKYIYHFDGDLNFDSKIALGKKELKNTLNKIMQKQNEV